MWRFISEFFSSNEYIPHGHCYLWQTPLVALHVVSDSLIAIAYFSIPITLIYFVKKRQDIVLFGVLTLFSAFIVLCGVGHLLDIWTLWHPDYWLSGLEHAATAFVSCLTAIQLISLWPQLLALKTPEQLEAINQALHQEILERQQAELERNRAYVELEFRVQERTLELQQSQQWLSRLIEQLPIGIVEWDLTGNITKWNPASEHIFGYSQDEVLGHHFKLLVLEQNYAYADEVGTALLNQQGGHFSISENKTKTGEIIICEWHNNPLVAVDGTVLGGISIVLDITERKRIEADRQHAKENLQKERECLRAILDSLADGIVACDENGHLMLFNNATREFHGLPEAPLPPDQWADHFDLYQADGVTPLQTHEIPLFRAFQGEIVHAIEIVIAPKHGRTRTLLTSGRAFFDEAGNKAGAVVAMHDISDRKEAEAALQKAMQETEYQSRLLRTVLDSTQDWIYAKDQGFRYILVNHSYVEALNCPMEAVLGKNDLELGFSEEQVFGQPAAGIRGFRTDDQLALAGEIVRNPYDPATVSDGTTRILDTSKTPLYNSDGQIFAMLGSSRDITDRYNAEASLRRSEAALKEKAEELQATLTTLRLTQTQMIQAEKMSSLGQLVAGIAHEINNPVNFIHGNLTPTWDYARDLLHLVDLYQQHVTQPSHEIQTFVEEIDLDFLRIDLPKLLDSMRMGTERIREIVLSLRNFSRLDEAAIKAVNLHEGIDSTLVILGNRLKATVDRPEIQIVKHYGDLPLVECYAGQLNQVFMNVLNNAIDAIAQRFDQGDAAAPMISIATTSLDEQHVTIQITDNGVGISESVQQRLFDPFFTTKPVGKGTGMGLSISYQIVTETHQGTLQCVSEPGQGATFMITIPIWQTADHEFSQATDPPISTVCCPAIA